MTKNYPFRFSRSVFWIVLLFYMCTFSNALWAGEERGTAMPFVQSAVTGTVTSKSDGMPLPGASVLVKGTSVAVSTDMEGNFSINPPADAVLVFSFTGFKSVEVPVAGKTSISVSMEDELTTLDEVVVIGYGTQKKSDVIGSVTSVPQERLKNLPVTNFTQAIQGTTAGVNVTQGSSVPGRTGSIRIRGLNSIAANMDPLIILDGMPFYGSYNDIPAADIKSMEILKDASATAIYGTRGSNGVILITTKRGNTGKPTISYNTYAAVENLTNELTPRSPESYVQKYQDYMTQRNLPQTGVLLNQNEIDNYNAGRTTNWLDEVTRGGFLQEHNLSITGGTEKAQYYLSASYLDQEGVIEGYQFHRATYRGNFDLQVTDWLKVGTQAYFNNNNYDGGRANFLNAAAMSPYSRPRDDNGNIIIFPMNPEQLWANPLLGLYTDRIDRSKNLTGNFYSEIKFGFLDGLKYRINGSYAYNPSRSADYTGREANNNAGAANIYNNEMINWTVENILSYTKDFGKHHVEALALYSTQERDRFNTSLGGSGFPNDALSFNNIGGATTVTAGSYASQETWLSQMGRLIYSYDSRYSLQLTARRDGFSGFGANTSKYGVFTAAGAAWNIHNESFMKDFSKLDQLKMRLSYGETGNMGVDAYTTITKNGTVLYPFNGTALVGTYINGMGNPNLNWETTATLNAAVDFGFFGNRITGTVEAYHSKTHDLLLNRTIPSITGSTVILDNVGKVENKGLEISLNSVNIDTKDFRWETNVNFSTYKNKITELYGDGKDDIANKWFLGKSLGAIYDFEKQGIWQESEIAAGAHLNQDPTARAGDIKFADLNGDGKIDAQNDRKYLGNSLPDWTGGITNRFTYKDFTLSIFFQTVQGVLKNNPDINLGDEQGRRNTPAAYGYWTPENQSNEWPSLIAYQNNKGYGFPKDASFIRLQDIRLSYNVPSELLSKFQINSLVLYASGRNLHTWTNWVGWDPENSQSYRGSGDWTNNYPLVQTFSLGLNVSF